MSSAPHPEIAVVIPGHNCGATLGACLQALVPLLASGQVAKIVFVDDHSSDATRGVAEGFAVQVLSSPRRGAGAARNVGWRAANTEWVWFVDSDCVAEADALSRLCRASAELGAAVVGGSYANQNHGCIVADLIHEEMVARHRAMGRDVTFAITANLLCRRESLERLAGFDESLRLGQDLDFAYRLVQSGSRLGFDATSRVAHFHETRLWSYLVKQARQGFWRMHLYRRHPQRMKGDTYSGLLDYVQPPLALLAFAAPALGLLWGAPVLGVSGGLLAVAALVSCQLPRATALVRSTRDARYWSYVPFGAARALFRGVGMLLGMAAVSLEGRWQGPLKPLEPAP
jgi:GT2 family glycosyltransferase